MTGVWLRATVRGCLHCLVLILLVGVVRLAYVAWEKRAPTVTLTPVRSNAADGSNPSPTLPFDLEALRSRLASPVPSDLMPLHETLASAGSTSRPSRNQVYLVVNVIPDRSEVLINGVAHGHTPYVGEVSCQNGAKLTITVLPPKGMPKQFVRLCDRREIRVDE
jgi:hypothetical protein